MRSRPEPRAVTPFARQLRNLGVKLPTALHCGTGTCRWVCHALAYLHGVLGRKNMKSGENMRNQHRDPTRAVARAVAGGRTPIITAPENQPVRTADGWIPVSDLAVNDVVLDAEGRVCVVDYVSKTCTIPDFAPSSGADLGNRTRFPGVRFVRGKPAEAVYHLILRPVPEDIESDAAPKVDAPVERSSENANLPPLPASAEGVTQNRDKTDDSQDGAIIAAQ